jgi:hypothetical protein
MDNGKMRNMAVAMTLTATKTIAAALSQAVARTLTPPISPAPPPAVKAVKAAACFGAVRRVGAGTADDLEIAEGRRHRGGDMTYIGIGIVLLVLGWLSGIYILWVLGVIAVVIGLIFFLLSLGEFAGPGRRPWYHRRYW